MNVTPAIAAIFIAIIVCAFGCGTVLVIKGFMSVDMLISLLKNAGYILLGSLLPITYRRRPNGGVSFHIDSDPPKPPPPEMHP